MSPQTIIADSLSKTYQVPEREGGFGAAVSSFFKRKYKDVKAVQGVNFTISQGEIVGFLGPNGAGKTTTLKMLSGLLHPTGGKANVLGFTPWELKPEYLRAMTLVMGQRNRLSWDIPAADSFLLNQAIYRLPDDEYKATYKELDELLELDPLMKKPVRNLSLGDRMNCKNITGQVRIREFLREYNRRTGATILLTSHYMADVTALCERIIIIHHGQLKYDGAITDLARRIAPFKLIGVALLDGVEDDLSRYGTPIPNENGDGKRLIQV